MALFDKPGADAAYDRWLDPPDLHEECGCRRICHAAHLDEGRFEEDCPNCQWEKGQGLWA